MTTDPFMLVAIAAVSLVLYGLFKRLGLGYAFRIGTLAVALFIWYGAAGGFGGMVTQVKDVGVATGEWASSTASTLFGTSPEAPAGPETKPAKGKDGDTDPVAGDSP